jgi:hypothetical protein
MLKIGILVLVSRFVLGMIFIASHHPEISGAWVRGCVGAWVRGCAGARCVGAWYVGAWVPHVMESVGVVRNSVHVLMRACVLPSTCGSPQLENNKKEAPICVPLRFARILNLFAARYSPPLYLIALVTSSPLLDCSLCALLVLWRRNVISSQSFSSFFSIPLFSISYYII